MKQTAWQGLSRCSNLSVLKPTMLRINELFVWPVFFFLIYCYLPILKPVKTRTICWNAALLLEAAKKSTQNWHSHQKRQTSSISCGFCGRGQYFQIWTRNKGKVTIKTKTVIKDKWEKNVFCSIKKHFWMYEEVLKSSWSNQEGNN